jgi:hypothetical protein
MPVSQTVIPFLVFEVDILQDVSHNVTNLKIHTLQKLDQTRSKGIERKRYPKKYPYFYDYAICLFALSCNL